MKIGIVGDIHWSKYSSIVRSRGTKYSTRLENCIKSVQWAEDTIKECNCDLTVYLGDFFDKSELSAEEITALGEIVWNDTPHRFLVGNHEMGINDLKLSSSHLFNLLSDSINDFDVVDFPRHQVVTKGDNKQNILYLPYILEEQRESLDYYIPSDIDNLIIFSHNDIKGIQMGAIISPSGFSQDEISNNCNLFINGHIHNGSKINDKIINIGNLTGQNFSEDATKYNHSIIILDTITMQCAVYDNPYAFNFYKFDVTIGEDQYRKIESIVNNAVNPVITIKLLSSQKDVYDKLLSKTIAHRMIVQPEFVHNDNNKEALETLSINHLEKFKEYILDELGNNDDVINELKAVIN